MSKCYVAGVDEAGRGPLAGPVTAAAVILPEGIDGEHDLLAQGLTDSKVLSPQKRAGLYSLIVDRAVAWSFGVSSVVEIDQINILQASLLAMRRALDHLDPRPTHVLVDGIHAPVCTYASVQTVIRGDAKIVAISAASIIAKVVRDTLMAVWDAHYPGYGFAQHKGYPTVLHHARLHALGVSPLHRRSFAPVARCLNKAKGHT